MIPDKESDIKPRFHRARRHSMGRTSEEVGTISVWHFTEILQKFCCRFHGISASQSAS